MATSDRARTVVRDFPFYGSRPIVPSAAGWALVLAGCAAGFIALISQGQVWPSPAGRWCAVGLFVGLPLIALRLAAGRAWIAFLPRPRWKDVWIGLAFMPLVVAASALVAVFVARAGPTSANPIFEMLARMSPVEAVLFAVSTLPQLFGEELITLLPFLAIMTALHRGGGWSRGWAMFAAWIVSALIFGALHLPTYGWNLAQALGVIGVARLVLTLPFLVTKSVWSSTVCHVVNDWAGFLLVLGVSALRP